MDDFSIAAVCELGHVYSADVSRIVEAAFCDRCGSAVRFTCPSCDEFIRGAKIIGGMVLLQTYTPPQFCFACSSAFPWANRRSRVLELQRRLNEEAIDPAAKLAAREQLDALLDSELSDKEQISRWKRIRAAAPGFLDKDVARTIFESLAEAAIRSQT